MRHLFFLGLLLLCLFAQAQEPIDNFKEVLQVNDSTWNVREYNVYEYSVLFDEVEYTFSDTVLIPENTAYFDSAGIVRYLFVSASNEQQTQSAIISRAFDAVPTLRNVTDANTLITSISNNESNFFEEAAKQYAAQLIGRYRIFYDSLGQQKNTFAQMELVSNVAHPDGRSMRLVMENGQTFTVKVSSRWSWNIVSWPYGESRYVWHRSLSTADRPLYRPHSYITRQETWNRIIKVN